MVRAATANTAAPVVLVGHSGAGLLLPAIADVLTVEVAALVFVDSFLPPANGTVRLAPPGLMDQLWAVASDGVLPRGRAGSALRRCASSSPTTVNGPP